MKQLRVPLWPSIVPERHHTTTCGVCRGNDSATPSGGDQAIPSGIEFHQLARVMV
jgi:hypothetical protein